METRTPTPDDDVVSIDRWEGDGGARTSPAEEARHATLASVTDHDNVSVRHHLQEGRSHAKRLT